MAEINPSVCNRVFHGVVQFVKERYGENECSIKSFSIETPCSTTDNFLSEIHAVKVGVKSPQNCKDIQYHELIGKSQMVDEGNTDLWRYYYNLLFNKEKLLYTDVMERMEDLLSEIGYDHTSLAPKLHTFYTEGEAYSCIFMDNLVSQGFYTPKSHGAGVELDECKSIVKAMARFHALSLVMEGKDGISFPEKYQLCSSEFFLAEQMATSMKPIVQGSYLAIIDLAKIYRPDLVYLLSQLDQEESAWDRLCKLVQPDMSSFSCLCHGDSRLNNIFINKENPNVVKFIDFQLTRYASPLTDLQYTLNMGATKEFRSQYTDDVLQAYHEEFSTILNSFPSVKLLPEKEAAVKGWSLEKLKEDYEEMTMYGFLISMTLLPVILLRPGDIDKAVSQMTKDEREKFWNFGRRALFVELGTKHADVRERLFDICDEAFAIINKSKV